MDDVKHNDGQNIEQVFSLFKAAFKLLEVDREGLEDEFLSDDAENLDHLVGNQVLQDSVDQGSSNVNPKFLWNHEAIVLLLEQYRKVEHDFYLRRKRHGILWNEIAAALREQSSINVTSVQCQQKMSGLKRTWANIKLNYSNYDSEEWPYYSAVDELFGDKEHVMARIQSCGAEIPVSNVDDSNNAETGTSETFFLWHHEGVLSLLEKYEEMEEEFYTGKKRHNKIWEEIAEAVNADNKGFRVTGLQCQQKISGMKRTYWSIKETHPCPSANTVPWLYYEAADKLFNRKPRVIPAIPQSSSHGVQRKKTNSTPPPTGDDGSTDTNKKNMFHWSYGGVFLLLDQYREVEHEFYINKRRHSKIWDGIAEAIRTMDSYLKPTGVHCQQKISGLKRTYLSIKENHPCPNSDTVSWPYYTVVDEIFGKGHNSSLGTSFSDNDGNPKMYVRNIVKRSSFKWPHEGVLLLLRVFQEKQQEFFSGVKKNCKIWDEIAEAIQANSELKPTGIQCQQKINGLKRMYADSKDNSSDSWPYFHIMDEIFGSTDSIPAPAIACSTGPEMQKDNIYSSSSDDENDTGTCTNNVYERNVFVWTHEGIVTLLRQYKKFESEFSVGNKVHIKIWDQIAAAVHSLTNLKVTGVRCLQKLFRLKRLYKSIKESNPCISSETVTWPYFSIMDEMFGDKAAGPTIACSSGPDPPLASIKPDSSNYNVRTRTIRESKKTWFVWPYEAVLLLLEQYRRVKHEFFRGEKRHSQIWDEIAEGIEAVDSMYKITGALCQQKISYLKSTYTTLKKKHPGFDTEQISWPFFSAMENLFDNRVQIADSPVLFRPELVSKQINFTSSSDEYYEGDGTQATSAKKRKLCTQHMHVKDISKDVEVMRLKQERKQQEREERKYKMRKTKMKQIRVMHEEKINMQRAALNILKQILLK